MGMVSSINHSVFGEKKHIIEVCHHCRSLDCGHAATAKLRISQWNAMNRNAVVRDVRAFPKQGSPDTSLTELLEKAGRGWKLRILLTPEEVEEFVKRSLALPVQGWAVYDEKFLENAGTLAGMLSDYGFAWSKIIKSAKEAAKSTGNNACESVIAYAESLLGKNYYMDLVANKMTESMKFVKNYNGGEKEVTTFFNLVRIFIKLWRGGAREVPEEVEEIQDVGEFLNNVLEPGRLYLIRDKYEARYMDDPVKVAYLNAFEVMKTYLWLQPFEIVKNLLPSGVIRHGYGGS